MNTQTLVEMPKYKCHKVVTALKIKEIHFDRDEAKKSNRETTGEAVIMPSEEGYASFSVSADYIAKHKPVAGGYFVRYEDGYASFSPADAFESGYTKL